MEGIVSSFIFDTDDYPEPVRYEVWREVMAATHDVEPGETVSAPFRIRVEACQLGQMIVTSGELTAQSFIRTSEHIRRDHLDHYGLFLQGAGIRHGQAGGDYVLTPGDIQVVDLAQSDRSVASAGRSGTVYLPRDVVDDVIPGCERLHGKVLRSGAAALFAQHLQGMGTLLPLVPPAALAHLARATQELAMACLQAERGELWEMNAGVWAARRAQVERYIDAHLTDQDLSPTVLERACDLSRSALYRLFERNGGVMSFIKRRRLQRIRSILMTGVDSRSLAAIGEDYGFQSGAHLGREFRKEFGYAPGELRGHRHERLKINGHAPAPLDVLFRTL